MRLITLAPIPNQSLSVRLDEDAYRITIKLCVNIMAATIDRNNVRILSNSRIVGGFPIIPYRYLESGNFLLTTLGEEYPDYQQFGITQFLTFASADELELIRAGN